MGDNIREHHDNVIEKVSNCEGIVINRRLTGGGDLRDVGIVSLLVSRVVTAGVVAVQRQRLYWWVT